MMRCLTGFSRSMPCTQNAVGGRNTIMRRLLASIAVASASLVLPGLALSPAGAKPSPNCAADPVPWVNLSGCDLRGLDFSGSDLTRANLSGSNLKGADLTDADLTGANLIKVRSGSIVGDPSSLPSNWIVEQGYLVGPVANLKNASLRGADLSASMLHKADFTGADLTDVDFTGSELRGARFDNSNLTRTIFADSDLQWAQFVSSTLTGTDLSGANMTAVKLRGSTFTNVNLAGADFTRIRIVGDVPSSGLRGSPKHLPSGWSIVGGTLYWLFGG